MEMSVVLERHDRAILSAVRSGSRPYLGNRTVDALALAGEPVEQQFVVKPSAY
jgi:hypothetical protein